MAQTLSERQAAQQYNQAGTLYQQKKFEESLKSYEQLIDRGIRNADLFYNASNAAYRSGDIGKAVLYIEKALRLSPSDKDALANRSFLNAIKEDQESPDTNAVLAFITGSYNSITQQSARFLSAISFAFALLMASALLFIRKKWAKISLFGVIVFSGTLFLCTSVIAIHKYNQHEHVREAVVMNDEAKSYSGPGTENTLIFTIHEGTKVVIERRQGEWLLIRLSSGAGGWIFANSVREI
jgi:tetratricopeptide (TPR) repeat protein